MCIISILKAPDPIPSKFWKVFEVLPDGMYRSAFGYYPETTYRAGEWITAEKQEITFGKETGFHAFFEALSAATLASWLVNYHPFMEKHFIILPVELENIVFFGREVEGNAAVAERMRICV
jgi:hypothetical protein